jgi:hypothetical protein
VFGTLAMGRGKPAPTLDRVVAVNDQTPLTLGGGAVHYPVASATIELSVGAIQLNYLAFDQYRER